MTAARTAVVVSTGRTATQALARWLDASCAGVTAWHEPFPSRALRPLCHLYAAGRVPAATLAACLRPGYRWRRRRLRGDRYVEASPYLRACVDLLPGVYDDPLVVHLVRDPRSYVVSYINHGAFAGIKGLLGEAIPYWQLKPEHLDRQARIGWRAMSPHERICWRWDALNRLIEHGAASLPEGRYLRLRFEDILEPATGGLRPLLDALGLDPPAGEGAPALSVHANRSLRRRHPRAEHWSDQMRFALETHCGERMRRYGYT